MEPGKNPLPARDQASKIAAAYRSIPLEDLGKKQHPPDEDVQNPDLDRVFDELVESYGSKKPTDKMAVRLPDIISTPGDELGGAASHYECPECGHPNPGENEFCGKCGAAHGETVIAPARRITDEGSVALDVSSSSGIKHFHHHYHHTHYRSSPYLILSIVVLLAAMAWHTGWEYGLRAGMAPSPTTLPSAVKPLPANVPSGANANSVPASAEAEDGKREALPAEAKGTRSAKRRAQPNRSSDSAEVVWFRRPPKAQPRLVRPAPQPPGSTATQNAPSDTPAQSRQPIRE